MTWRVWRNATQHDVIWWEDEDDKVQNVVLENLARRRTRGRRVHACRIDNIKYNNKLHRSAKEIFFPASRRVSVDVELIYGLCLLLLLLCDQNCGERFKPKSERIRERLEEEENKQKQKMENFTVTSNCWIIITAITYLEETVNRETCGSLILFYFCLLVRLFHNKKNYA